MFTSRSVWYLPAVLVTVAFLLYATIGTWYNGSVSESANPYSLGALDDILSQDTVEALYADARLHRALVSLTDGLAKASSELGDTYGSTGLRDFGRNLGEEVSRWRVTPPQKRKRGLLDSLGAGGNLIGAGAGDANITGGLAGILQEGISSLGGSLADGLATPALFLGIGIGMGVDTGFNLTDRNTSQAVATQVAAAYNAQATGFNLVAQNLGAGASAQLAPSLGNLSSGGDIGIAAFALAQGIGQGSASGLKLTQQQFQPSNDSSITAIAGNLGLGIALPIASSIDAKSLFSQAGASGGQLMAQIPQIAAAAGRGFGEGASTGLGLQKQKTTPQRRQAPADSSQVDIPGAVEEFSRGLSQSFLQNADLKTALGGGVNIGIMGMLVPIAAGAGQGIGEGAAIGLGFKADTGLSVNTGNMSSTQSTQMITSEFTKELVASFLANGTASTALAGLTAGAGGLTMNIQPSKVAEGLARGLVQGSVNAISMAGGIENVLSGNFSLNMAMSIPEMESTNFNDSVNGSAVAFGRGLAGEGTLLIASMITNMSKQAPQKRSIEMSSAGVVHYDSLKRRAESSPLAADSSMLSGLAQAGTTAITCQGFGGLAALGLGLIKSGTVKIDTKNAVPLDNATLAILPKEPIRILSEGNKFEITIQDTKVTVNDMAIVPFAVVTALHILFITFAFFFAHPAYLTLGAIWRISVLIGHPLSEAKNKKWRKRILLMVFLPTSVIGIIFGIIGMGKATHFDTAHGIFGLITFIFLIPTIVTSIQRLNTDVPIPPPSAFLGIKQIPKIIKSPMKVHFISAIFQQMLMQFGTIAWVTGFSELRSISLCIVDAFLTAPAVVGPLTGILFLQVGGMSIVGLRGWLEKRIAEKEIEASKGTGAVEVGRDFKTRDTMKTFGFGNEKEPHPGVEVFPGKLELQSRNTGQLLGHPDSQIGYPTQVRKMGDDGGFERVDYLEDNPFADPAGQGRIQQRQTYNEKLGGYTVNEDQTAARADNPANNLFANPAEQTQSQRRQVYDGDDSNNYTSYRRSSDIMPGYSGFTVDGRPETPPRLPRESRDRDASNAQQYKSFSRPTQGRESGEEIRVVYGNVGSGVGKVYAK